MHNARITRLERSPRYILVIGDSPLMAADNRSACDDVIAGNRPPSSIVPAEVPPPRDGGGVRCITDMAAAAAAAADVDDDDVIAVGGEEPEVKSCPKNGIVGRGGAGRGCIGPGRCGNATQDGIEMDAAW